MANQRRSGGPLSTANLFVDFLLRFPIIVDAQLQRWEDVMTFTNFVSQDSAARERLFLEYISCVWVCSGIAFRNQSWADYLVGPRFPALAGWQKDPEQIWGVLNQVTLQRFSQFQFNGQPARPADNARYGEGGKGFGWGTVHHAVGSLRMPYRPRLDAPFARHSVVDEDLRVVGTDRLYVCDMSVIPLRSAANPVRTLVALALRLSRHLG